MLTDDSIRAALRRSQQRIAGIALKEDISVSKDTGKRRREASEDYWSVMDKMYHDNNSHHARDRLQPPAPAKTALAVRTLAECVKLKTGQLWSWRNTSSIVSHTIGYFKTQFPDSSWWCVRDRLKATKITLLAEGLIRTVTGKQLGALPW